ncbi:hypothetical protein BUALT_Bualt10G0004800 [Buddleja alternifolia]|uniref:Uncharacterized protein n=1 Tax=Buddleja alternifolia TaxID=168488 RepID=A0AAV6WVZ5_9LAMI|nr:hypothetical protein BUALT_Bualt10G0004800 [Buddleja alternifolia]
MVAIETGLQTSMASIENFQKGMQKLMHMKRSTKLATIHYGYTDKDLPEEFFYASFLSGLKEEIGGAVMAVKPNDFHQVVSLAKRQEFTVDAIIKRDNITTRNFNKPKPNHRTFPTNNAIQKIPNPPPKPPDPPNTESLQTHRKPLTASEMRARREKNLCYNCDETFVPGHRSITTIVPSWIIEIQDSYNEDEKLIAILPQKAIVLNLT